MLPLVSDATVCITISKFRGTKVDLQHVKSVPLTDNFSYQIYSVIFKSLADLHSEMLLLLWLG